MVLRWCVRVGGGNVLYTVVKSACLDGRATGCQSHKTVIVWVDIQAR